LGNARETDDDLVDIGASVVDHAQISRVTRSVARRINRTEQSSSIEDLYLNAELTRPIRLNQGPSPGHLIAKTQC
jgi:hypothetical protein